MSRLLIHIAKSMQVAALTLTCTIASAQTIVSGNYSVDDKSGCNVWNPNPKATETIIWSGPCASGFANGQGKLQWLQNGQVYETDEGEWSAGRQVGRGSQVWPLGRYDGEISNSEPNGRGVLILKGARYDGEFRNGKPNGSGTVTSQRGVIKGTWKDGCLTGAKQKVAVGVPLSACL